MADSSSEWWRPTRTLTTWLSWLLGVVAAGQFALVFLDSATPYVRFHAAIDALFDERNEQARTLFSHAYDGTDRGWVQVVGYVSAAASVLLIVWTWRSAHNPRALGRIGTRLAPVWAIIGWLIPLAAFVLPYLVISDLWRSSDPDAERGDAWRRLGGSPLVLTWWLVRVAGSVAGFGAMGLAVSGTWVTSPTDTVLAAGHALSAAGSVLAIVVVRRITDRQEAQQAADPAPTSRPQPRQHLVPATGDGPGWYADPGRRFDHRYWDGTAWTEHVSSAGEPSIAPVTPPDWYPDPTGRFHWRYWTGHEWTEHVSRDQELFLDPLPDG